MSDALQEAIKYEIFKCHNEIALPSDNVSCAYDLKLNGASAQYDYTENTIRYDLEDTLRYGIKKIVIHEFAHYLQFRYFGYTTHDLLFMLINQYLVVKHLGEAQCYMRAYDISAEAKIPNISLPFLVELMIQAKGMPRGEAIRFCHLIQLAYTGPREFEDLDTMAENHCRILTIKERGNI